MCTGSGFSHVHHNGVGSFNVPAMTAVLSYSTVPRGEKELDGGGGENESAV